MQQSAIMYLYFTIAGEPKVADHRVKPGVARLSNLGIYHKCKKSFGEGGVNFPNIRGYNLACLFRHALDWVHEVNCYSNWDLESSLAAPWSLLSLLHTGVASLPTGIKGSLTLRDTIIAWREVRKLHNLPLLISKHMPLWGLPQSPPNLNSSHCRGELTEKGVSRVRHVIHSEMDRWLSPGEVINRYSLPKTVFFTVSQILSFCRSRLRDPAPERTANPFDDLLTIAPGYYGISRLYGGINKCLIKISPVTAFSRWEDLLSTPEAAKIIQTGWSNVRKHVPCEAWRDSHFRFMHRAIYGFEFPKTPANPSRITECPKCQTPFTDLWHGVWLCPNSQRFWDQVITYVDLHWRVALPKSPELLLFHCTRPPEGTDDSGDGGVEEDILLPSLIHTILLLAKRCLFQRWLESETPDIDMIVRSLKSNLLLDKAFTERHKEKGTKGFFKKWRTFIVTHYSDEEIGSLMKTFLHTAWYAIESLRGSLGRLCGEGAGGDP